MSGAPFASRAELLIKRTFDAPRKLVFKVWTDPKHLAQWWGPRGFTTEVHEMDVGPGGVWRYSMHGPDGSDYPFDGVYVEVVEPEWLVFDGSIQNRPSSECGPKCRSPIREQRPKLPCASSSHSSLMRRAALRLAGINSLIDSKNSW